jgi:polar amino acid transport system substrate-binding protein
VKNPVRIVAGAVRRSSDEFPGGIMIGKSSRGIAVIITMAIALPAFAQVAVPAPGASPRVDAIKKAGVLRVGVLANAPWLVENTTSGPGEAWSGPAWVLANEYAKRLNVKLEAVPSASEGPPV